MDFGKVASCDGIDFTLPDDDPRSVALLSSSSEPRVETPRIHAGAPVWKCREWVGKVYPPKTPERDYLLQYAKHWNAIELNSTFYSVPEVKTLRAWRDAVTPGFVFAPKFSRDISHTAARLDESVKRYTDAVSELGPHLGMCFLQLPPSAGREKLPWLEKLLSFLPGNFQLAVEFRDPSWFVRHRLISPAFNLLSAGNHSAVITDVPGRRDVLHGSLTSRRTFIRFAGNELHPSDYTRIDDWTVRIASWIDQGVSEVYFFLHHPTYVNVPELTDYFSRKLAGSTQGKINLAFKLSTPGQLKLY